jgi:HEPN domain-containing protein
MKRREDPEVAEWLRRADADRLTAALVLPHGLCDITAFHCQQEAEKLLKALLVAQSEIPPRTHDLGVLVDRLVAVGLSMPDVADAARLLTPFVAMSRYPGFGELDEAQARQALAAAQTVRDGVVAAFCSLD